MFREWILKRQFTENWLFPREFLAKTQYSTRGFRAEFVCYNVLRRGSQRQFVEKSAGRIRSHTGYFHTVCKIMYYFSALFRSALDFSTDIGKFKF